MKPRISDASKTATIPGFVPPYQNVIAPLHSQVWNSPASVSSATKKRLADEVEAGFRSAAPEWASTLAILGRNSNAAIRDRNTGHGICPSGIEGQMRDDLR